MTPRLTPLRSVDQLIPTDSPNASAPKARPIKAARAATRKIAETLAPHIAGLEARSQTETVFSELIANIAKRTNPDRSRRITSARDARQPRRRRKVPSNRTRSIDGASFTRLALDIAPEAAAKKPRGRMNGRRSEKRGAHC